MAGGGGALGIPIPISNLASLEEAETSLPAYLSPAESRSPDTERYYRFFTLPTTEKWYEFVGVEWKNLAVVAGNFVAGVCVVNANPPTTPSALLVALTAEVAQAGINQVQRVSTLFSSWVRGGTHCAVWFHGDNVGAQFEAKISEPSQIHSKTLAYSRNPALNETATWNSTTTIRNIKAYFRGVAKQ